MTPIPYINSVKTSCCVWYGYFAVVVLTILIQLRYFILNRNINVTPSNTIRILYVLSQENKSTLDKYWNPPRKGTTYIQFPRSCLLNFEEDC